MLFGPRRIRHGLAKVHTFRALRSEEETEVLSLLLPELDDKEESTVEDAI